MTVRFQAGRALGTGVGKGAQGGARGSLRVLGESRQECSRWADSGALCVSNSAFLPSHPRLGHETKLCEQMVLMVQDGIPPDRPAKGSHHQLPRPAGNRREEGPVGGGEAGAGLPCGAGPRGKVLRAGEPGLDAFEGLAFLGRTL